MISDELTSTAYALNSAKVMSDSRMDHSFGTTDQSTDQIAIVVSSPNDVLAHDSQPANSSPHCTSNQEDEASNIENHSNQISLVEARPKRNLLINSKRPKSWSSDYKSDSAVRSNSKKIVRERQSTAKHTCDFCSKSFSRKFHLTRHLTTTSCTNKTKTAQYVCEICGKTYNRKDNLQEHLRIHAGEITRQKNYTCGLCGKSFHGLSLLQIHERVHTGEKPFACDHCDKRFPSNSALNKHTRIHTGEKPYKCDECDVSFTLKGTLNRHMYTHNDKKKPHTCQFCQKSFIQKSGLKAHLFYHTGENGFTCETCGRQFNRKARLQMHTKYVHEKARSFHCKKCGHLKFANKDDLRNHLFTVHEEPDTANKTANKKKFKCKICSSKFQLKESLKVHELTHSKSQSVKCGDCDRIFLSQEFLTKHHNAQHRRSPVPSSSRAISIAIELEVGQLDSDDDESISNNYGEICLRDCEFNEELKKLLMILVDQKALQSVDGWPN